MPDNTENTLKLAHLRRLVELHDNFWHELLARQPDNSNLLAFVADEWGPWYVQWSTLPWNAGYDYQNNVDVDFITAASQALSSLRQAAESRGVAFPDLGTGRRGVDWNLQARTGHGRTRAPDNHGHHAQARSSGESPDLVGRRFGGGTGGRRGHRGRAAYQAPYQQIAQPPSGGYGETADPGEGDGETVGGGPPLAPYPYYTGCPGQVVEVVPGVPTEVTLFRPAPATMTGADLDAVHRGHRHRRGQYDAGGDLAAAADVAAPDREDVRITLDVDAAGRLHAAVAVDGHVYQGSADLAPMLDYLAATMTAAPAQDPAPVDPADPAGAPAPTPTAESAAVEAAGDMLVGALLDQHALTLSAGWWSSVTGAVSSAAKGVYNAGRHSYNYTTGVVAKFKGPITVAATAVATAYGGPAAGAAAAKFTGPILDAAHDGFNKPEAKKAVAQIKEAAKTNPQVAHAFDVAQKAVAETTAAYHVVDTAANALNGDKASIRKVAELGKAATAGDSSASKAMAMIFEALDNYGASSAGGSGDATSADQSIADYEAAVSSGASGPGTLEQDAEVLVADMAARTGAPFVGYVRERSNAKPRRGAHGGTVTLGDTEEAFPFGSQDEADHWYTAMEQAPRGRRVYVAYFDTSGTHGPLGPNVLARFSDTDTTIGGLGLLPWLALGAGVGLGYRRWRRGRNQRRHEAKLAEQDQVLNASADAAIAAANGAPVQSGGAFLPFMLGAGLSTMASAFSVIERNYRNRRNGCRLACDGPSPTDVKGDLW